MVKKKAMDAENVFVLIALIVLNVLFVVHILFAWVGVLIGFIAGSIALVVAGVATLIASVAYPVVSSFIGGNMLFGNISIFAVMFLSVAMICLGGLWMIGNYYLVKYSYRAVAWYVKLNVRTFKKYGD